MSSVDIALGGESVQYSSLSTNQHIDDIDHVKRRKLLRCQGFSQEHNHHLIAIESANRFLKSIILPVLDYCGAVFHRCGKGNEEGLECLQR